MESMAQLVDARSREVAVEYRNLVLFFGGQIFLVLIGIAGRLAGRGVVSEALGAIASVGMLGSTAALIYQGYRTARAMGSDLPWAWAVGMLVPLVSIVTLILLSTRAQDICRNAGIPVGFMGPKLEDRTDTSRRGGAA